MVQKLSKRQTERQKSGTDNNSLYILFKKEREYICMTYVARERDRERAGSTDRPSTNWFGMHHVLPAALSLRQAHGIPQP